MNRFFSLLLMMALAASVEGVAQAVRFDVVITEIMADPSPPAGLPNAEYIEIRNISTTAFNLNGWKLSDASSTASITSNFILQPDSAVVLCANANVIQFSLFGRTIGISSFPSLDNEGDQLVLRSPQGKIIHAVAYTSDWHQNALKKDGGWSLEMIDVHNPCGGAGNWTSSTDPNGGTPGKKNAVEALNADGAPPQLVRSYSIDSLRIVAVFNETLDSVSAALSTNYSLENGPAIFAAEPLSPFFDKVILTLSAPLHKRTVYQLTAINIRDCKNNIGALNKIKAGVAELPVAGDIVINEILFNPKPDAVDFAEVYNRSNKIIDAAGLFIANRNATGSINTVRKMSETSFAIFPGDHIALTEDPSVLQRTYFVPHPLSVLRVSSMPSYPDDKGTVVILDAQGSVLDEVSYSEKWHFALITEPEGFSLERIDPAGRSQTPDNWHSAATTAGFGTPTGKNSQYKQTERFDAWLHIGPKIFSPDTDGRDDITTISYQLNEAGYVANIIIFDAAGRPVKYLVKNALLSTKGSWNWDGLGEQQQKLPAGTYIVCTELFNLQGKKKQFKNAVILTRKPN